MNNGGGGVNFAAWRKGRLRIVFMGTPEFAATCLETLLEGRHEVVGVVTAPDRESGRGRKISQSAGEEARYREGLAD